MNVFDFFASPESDLPISWSDFSGTFDEYLKLVLDQHQSLVSKIDEADILSTEVIAQRSLSPKLCADLLEVLKLRYEGHPSKAYDIFKTSMRRVRPQVDALMSNPDISKEMTHLYRLRLGNMMGFSKEQLFHLPFELRHLVDTKRYSIPGLPCLYLGGSIYVCWEEMNRPTFDQVHASRFTPARGANIQVLDFGYRAQHMAGLAGELASKPAIERRAVEFVAAQVICWPLIAACSIQVRERKAPFKPEYIISHILLEWLTSETDCDGIRFFSSRIVQQATDPVVFCNFAFPARMKGAGRYCAVLTKKFELTDPVNWQLGLTVGLPGAASPHCHFMLEMEGAPPVDYTGTQFAKLQDILAGLTCSAI